MDEQPNQHAEPTEEELRAAYEEQLRQLRVEDVVVQTVVSLINLGARKAGLAPGAESERDLDQLRQAIEGVRALLPLVEPVLGPDAAQLRQALSQLQMTYAREAPAGGQQGGEERPAEQGGEQQGQGPGPAQSSGRLWVPGQ